MISAVTPNARSAHVKVVPNSKEHLLKYMKLNEKNDGVVYEKILVWVSVQNISPQIHPTKASTCRASSALLLQRLVRAFEQRQLNSASDENQKAKSSSASGNTSSPSTFKTSSSNGSQTFQLGRATQKPKRVFTVPGLMQRKVKVTKLVQHAMQFVGSDVLKVLQVLPNSPTVADVANSCLDLFREVKRIKQFYRIFSIASGKDLSLMGETDSTFFGVFALQALQSLRAQAISAYEFSHDFEMIYRTCYQDQNFQLCVHELNPAMTASVAPDTEARNICWKLARLLALKQDHNDKSDPEAKDHRRKHILLSATSIILAANIGKSIKNGEVMPEVAQKIISDDVDFVALVAAPVSDLINFLTKSTSRSDGITPIDDADIRSHVMDTCMLINSLETMKHVHNNLVDSFRSNSILAKAFSPAKHQFFLLKYRNIIETLVQDTQRELKINTAFTQQGKTGAPAGRTGIANVLLLFPMVIGEPWGIHRDAPMITSKMMCSGETSKQSDALKDSVAVVLKMKPRPKVIKRKATTDLITIPDSIVHESKRAKTTSISESPKKMPNELSLEPIDLLSDSSPSPGPTTTIDGRAGEIEAPIVNDLTELNEWTFSILSLSVIKPTDTLFTYLGENDRKRGNSHSCLQDVIVPVLNRGVLRIQNAIRSFSNNGLQLSNTKLTIGRRDGQVYVNGQVDQNIQLCASVVGFFFHALEVILQDQMKRMEFLGSFLSRLQSEPFHRALLACCYSCVLKGVGRTQKFQLNRKCENITVQVLMEITESDSFTFLKVLEEVRRSLVATGNTSQKQIGCPIVAGFPVILEKHVQKIEIQLIDSVLWNTSTASENLNHASFPLAIMTMKSLPGAWPPDILEPMLPEEISNTEGDSLKVFEVRHKPSFGSSSEASFISFVMRKLLKSIYFRIRAVCAALNLSQDTLLHTQILVSFRYLLRYHISIFNDRHVDQLLLCSIYGVCRVMKTKPTTTFGKIIDAYIAARGGEQGERACRAIVRHVKFVSPGNENRRGTPVAGDIISFYNSVYVPKMQKYFLSSKSLKRSAELYKTKLDVKEISRDQIPKNKNPVESAQNRTSTSMSLDSKRKSASPSPKTQSTLQRKVAAKSSSVDKNGSASVAETVAINSTNDHTSRNPTQKHLGDNTRDSSSGISTTGSKSTPKSYMKTSLNNRDRIEASSDGNALSGSKEAGTGTGRKLFGNSIGEKSSLTTEVSRFSSSNKSDRTMNLGISSVDDEPPSLGARGMTGLLRTGATALRNDKEQTKTASPHVTVPIDGTIEDAQKRKHSSTGGKNTEKQR